MEGDTISRPDRDVKAEDDGADSKPTYRSWKKKYRKMRLVFDQKMQEGEALYKLEQEALKTARRLAVEKDRLLDMLLDVNNSAQIPPEKRFDLGLEPPSDSETLCLDIDRQSCSSTQGRKSYKKLLSEVPHSPFASARERFPDLVADLDAGRDSPADPNQGMPHPPSFLTADDIDNYLYDIDFRRAKKRAAAMAGKGTPPDLKDLLLPTLAPVASAKDSNHNIASSTTLAARELALRNPTSVYNWLRKNAPKTFLQDGEAHPDAAGSEEPGHGHGHGHNHEISLVRSGATGRGGGGRGSRGGGHADRGERGRGSVRGKKAGGGRGRVKEVDDAMDVDDDGAAGVATPTDSKKGGKRKRVVEDDAGYRPKGGSSRPTKRKRKSAGVDTELVSTPTASGPKKSRKITALQQKGRHHDSDDGDHDSTAAKAGDD